MEYLTWLAVVLGKYIGWLFSAALLGAIYIACNRWRDYFAARSYVRELTLSSTKVFDLENLSPIRPSGPLTRALQGFNDAFGVARKGGWLPQFSIDRELGAVGGSPVALVNPMRAWAGVLILTGLLFTLLQLQKAVGTLGTAFNSLAVQQEQIGRTASQPAPNPQGSDAVAEDAQQNAIKATMAGVAEAAGSAFRASLGFIFLAAGLLIISIVLQNKAVQLLVAHRKWAYEAYGSALPAQLPSSQTDAAHALTENLETLHTIVRELRNVAGSLGAIGSLSDTMQQARDAIVMAMDKLPTHIKSSVHELSTGVAAELTRQVSQTTEYTKQILAIYGEQEFRMKEIAGYAEAIRQASDRSTSAFEEMKGIPTHLVTLAESLGKHERSADRVTSAVEIVGQKLGQMPIEELRQASLAMLQATASASSVHANALNAVNDLAQKVESISNLDSQIQPKLGEIISLAREVINKVSALNTKSDTTRSEVVGGVRDINLALSVLDSKSDKARTTDKESLLKITNALIQEIKALSTRQELADIKSQLLSVATLISSLRAPTLLEKVKGLFGRGAVAGGEE